MKLGSLFDGIGGFPLAATMLGIEPVWASEIEKFPITVTKELFPNMKHLGSVCDIKGAEVEPVDIITFGSPCQDLSVAGKRAGMGKGTRSGLFSEAVRIIKEMRDGSGRTYPRYAVWENVPGAFSSNRGEDFRVVLESLAQIAEKEVSIPLPQDGKWEPAGLVEGDGWSIAWRTLDAQFWGVPQRRKRIFLVADFGGDRASEIFFEREGVYWNTTESRSSGQEVTGGVEGGVRATGIDGYNATETGDVSASLGVNCGMSTGRNGVRVAGFQPNQSEKTRSISYAEEVSPTIPTQGVPAICLHATQDPITAEDRSHALGANSSQVVMYNAEGMTGCSLTANNLDSVNNQTPQAVCCQTVRRLTPTECERLQGLPDNWTEGLSDSARYRALGNSVAVPCVKFILECIRRAE